MPRRVRRGQGNFFTGWFGGQRPMRFRDEIVPVAIYNDSAHFIADDTAADVRAFVSRKLTDPGVGNHRGLRLAPVSSPLLVTWMGRGGTGGDTVEFRVGLVADRPTEAAQTALTSEFSQGDVTALLFQNSVATANIPSAGERIFEGTTQTGAVFHVPDFQHGMILVPNGSELYMWDVTSNEAVDMGVAWREFPLL